MAIGFTLYQILKDKNNLKVGQTAPNFILKEPNGKTVELKDLRGQGVLINFWGSWCAPCKKEMPYINAAYNQHLKGVKIYGINIQESPITVNAFLSRYGINFPILLDQKGAVTSAYKIVPIPTTYLIDKNGKIVRIIVGAMGSTKEVVQNLKLIQP